MKPLYLAMALAITTTGLAAQDAPRFFSETYPSHALGTAMQWYGSLGGEGAELGTGSAPRDGVRGRARSHLA